MIDYFALALAHGLLVVALLRLARRGDLDEESAAEPAPAPAAEPSSVETRREARERRRRRA